MAARPIYHPDVFEEVRVVSWYLRRSQSAESSVLIVAVAHSKRRPAYFNGRL
ncbi:MAG: hypothetical protein SFV18_19415 [Bryobacteraceae bacterium]|nr:hypothetical protein [Bryobacteraceae bacterium]